MLTFKCVENSSFASSFYAVKGADQSEIITTLMKIISTNVYIKPLKAWLRTKPALVSHCKCNVPISNVH